MSESTPEFGPEAEEYEPSDVGEGVGEGVGGSLVEHSDADDREVPLDEDDVEPL